MEKGGKPKGSQTKIRKVGVRAGAPSGPRQAKLTLAIMESTEAIITTKSGAGVLESTVASERNVTAV